MANARIGTEIQNCFGKCREYQKSHESNGHTEVECRLQLSHFYFNKLKCQYRAKELVSRRTSYYENDIRLIEEQQNQPQWETKKKIFRERVPWGEVGEYRIDVVISGSLETSITNPLLDSQSSLVPVSLRSTGGVVTHKCAAPVEELKYIETIIPGVFVNVPATINNIAIGMGESVVKAKALRKAKSISSVPTSIKNTTVYRSNRQGTTIDFIQSTLEGRRRGLHFVEIETNNPRKLDRVTIQVLNDLARIVKQYPFKPNNVSKRRKF